MSLKKATVILATDYGLLVFGQNRSAIAHGLCYLSFLAALASVSLGSTMYLPRLLVSDSWDYHC